MIVNQNNGISLASCRHKQLDIHYRSRMATAGNDNNDVVHKGAILQVNIPSRLDVIHTLYLLLGVGQV